MKMKLGSMPGGSSEALLTEIRQLRTAFHTAARSVGDLRPAFRLIDKAIDKLIQDQFDSEEGWLPLSGRTLDERMRERNWYSRSPRYNSIGRWTGDMFDGLMGRGLIGSKRVYRAFYERIYDAWHDEGPSERVTWFHEGFTQAEEGAPATNQPPRPFWEDGERSAIAQRILREYFRSHISVRLRAFRAPLR